MSLYEEFEVVTYKIGDEHEPDHGGEASQEANVAEAIGDGRYGEAWSAQQGGSTGGQGSGRAGIFPQKIFWW